MDSNANLMSVMCHVSSDRVLVGSVEQILVCINHLATIGNDESRLFHISELNAMLQFCNVRNHCKCNAECISITTAAF
jgi:hypothetical protein